MSPFSALKGLSKVPPELLSSRLNSPSSLCLSSQDRRSFPRALLLLGLVTLVRMG